MHLTAPFVSAITLFVLLGILVRWRLIDRKREREKRIAEYQHFHDAPRQ